MTTSKKIAEVLGTTEKAIRKYARKNFNKPGSGQWKFSESEVKELIKALGKGQLNDNSEHGFTKYEEITLNWIINTGFWNGEENFSDIDANDVAKGIGKPISSVRGYIGSLIKKGYLETQDYEETNLPIIYAGNKLTWNDETNKYEL